jgi:hypothetical protein
MIAVMYGIDKRIFGKFFYQGAVPFSVSAHGEKFGQEGLWGEW